MSTPPLNPLVTAIRTKYPGTYDDMDDATLTKNVLAKYPQYSDLAAPKMQAPQTQMQKEPESTGEGLLAGIHDKVSKMWNQMTGAANQVYDVSTPNIATQVWKHLKGQPNDLDKIPAKALMAFLVAGGLPEAEAGEVGDLAVPDANIVRGEVHNAIAEGATKEASGGEAAAEAPETAADRLSGDDPAKQVERVMGDDNQVHEIPASEREAMDAYSGQRPPMTEAEKQSLNDQIAEKFDIKDKISKRGPNKGNPQTYKVFHNGEWKTLTKKEMVHR